MRQRLPFAFPLASADVLRRRALILAQLLSMDEGFCQVPVRSLKRSTLERMLCLYDEVFLSGFLHASFAEIKVTLSSRLISSAGKFLYARDRKKRMERAEIRMSGDFLTRLNDGPFSLNGLSVATAQEAFLVVFEHELCHAVETALFGSTGHSKRFLSLANGLFGHTDTCHSLPTRRQDAAQNGFVPGCPASFVYEGRMLTGVITYIGKTATIMVPAPFGAYRDGRGRRYDKYRVAVEALKKKS